MLCITEWGRFSERSIDMNTTSARLLAAKVAELIETASIFQSCYGKDYCMKPGSPRLCRNRWRCWVVFETNLTSMTGKH